MKIMFGQITLELLKDYEIKAGLMDFNSLVMEHGVIIIIGMKLAQLSLIQK